MMYLEKQVWSPQQTRSRGQDEFNAHGLHWHWSSRDVDLRTRAHSRGINSPGGLPVGEPCDVALVPRRVVKAANPSKRPLPSADAEETVTGQKKERARTRTC